MSSGDGAGLCFLGLPLAFLITTGGLESSARTESTQAAWRTTTRESARRRALRRLSVRARKAIILASASLASLSPLMREQPPRANAVRRASTKALRATGLSFRIRGLHVGANLKLGLEQRISAVTQHLGCTAGGGAYREVVRHNDPLEAGDVGQELPDLIVASDDRHVVPVSVEWRWTRLHRLRHHLGERYPPDFAAARDVVEEVGHLVSLGHQAAEQHQAGTVGFQTLPHVGYGATGELPLGAIGG